MYDENTGLIYLGSGQYYDPVTGRLLTRGVGSNPYKPGAYDPAGMMVAPLAMLGLVLSRKKKRGKWDTFIALLVVCVVVGMSVSACGPKNTEPAPAPIVIPKPEEDSDSSGGEPAEIPAPTSLPAPLPTPTEDLCGYSMRDENLRYDIIVFGGSDSSKGIQFANPWIYDSIGQWASDDQSNWIAEENLIPYPGYLNEDLHQKAGKSRQYEDAIARNLSPCDDVIIIGYSAGTESALMYAKWRIENNMSQRINAVVLLGPTFGSKNETGLGEILTFGRTEINTDGTPKLDYDDWADYITKLLLSGVYVHVFADSGTYQYPDQADRAEKYQEEYLQIKDISKKYKFDNQQGVNHLSATINDPVHKTDIYNDIRTSMGQP